MPDSFGVFDDVVAEIARRIKPKVLLDIGAGAGKYGKILREVSRDTRRIGVEIEPLYISQFGLNAIYDEVWDQDAAALMRAHLNSAFDLVIIGDCIEHLPKSVGIDLLNFLTYRCGYTVILSPEFVVQGTAGGIDSEAHISVWSDEDFRWHDQWAFDNCCTMNLFLLRGYQKASVSLRALVHDINKSSIPVMDCFRTKVVRTANLQTRIRTRIEVFDNQEVSFRP